MKSFQRVLVTVFIILALNACSSPEEKARDFYEKGMSLFEKGQYRKAKLELQNALQIKKDMVNAWHGLALIAEKQQRWEEYYKLLTQVVDLDKNHFDAQLRLAKIYLVANQLDKADEIAKKLEVANPESSEVLALVAHVYLKSKNYSKSVEYAQKALEYDQKNITVFFVLAAERIEQNDYLGAEKFVDKGLSLDSKDPALLILKTKIAQVQNDQNKLKDTLKDLVVLKPDNIDFRKAYLANLVQSGNNAEAEQFLRDRYQKNSNDETINELISFLYQVKGADVVVDEINLMIKRSPENKSLQFYLVDLYLKENQNVQALEILQSLSQSVESVETRIKAKEKLMAYAISQKDRVKALQLSEEVLNEDPKNVQALLLKATDQLDRKNIDAAILNLREVLRSAPDSAPALRLLGVAHDASGEKELAEDFFSRAYTASKFNPEYALFYSKYLVSLDRWERAINVLNESLETQPENIVLLNQLAQFHIIKEDWAKAQLVTDKISQLSTGNELSYQLQGVISAGQKDFAASIDSFKKSYEAFPDSPKPIAMLVKAYIESGQLDEAEWFLNKILAENPEQESSLLLLARVYIMQSRISEADTIYGNLGAKYPNNGNLILERARIQLGTGNPDRALTILNEGIANIPKNIQLLQAKAGILDAKNDVEASIAIYEKILEIKPDELVTINNLANLLVDHRGDQESLTRALTLVDVIKHIDNFNLKDTVGWVYYKNGMHEEADLFLRKAVELQPNNLAVRYHLAKNFEATKQFQKANEEYAEILKIAGETDFALRSEVEEGKKRTENKNDELVISTENQ